MYILDDGNKLVDAEFGFDAVGCDFCIAVESSGGSNPKRGVKRRNPAYNKLISTLLSRLSRIGARVTRIILDSGRVNHLPIDARVVALPFPYPINLSEVDTEVLRKCVGRSVSRMHRKPGAGSGGNTQKKIRIVVDRPITTEQLVTRVLTEASRLRIPDASASVNETERKYLRAARLGQGRFRAVLLKRYKARCVASGISSPDLLVASHIKPWDACTNEERLDPDNGLLLSALFDRLFDRGLISLTCEGNILVSPSLPPQDRVLCGLTNVPSLCFAGSSEKYLAYHRQFVFRSS
jgi:hypothetical protein